MSLKLNEKSLIFAQGHQVEAGGKILGDKEDVIVLSAHCRVEAIY